MSNPSNELETRLHMEAVTPPAGQPRFLRLWTDKGKLPITLSPEAARDLAHFILEEFE